MRKKSHVDKKSFSLFWIQEFDLQFIIIIKQCCRIKKESRYTDTADIPGLTTQPDPRITPYAEVYLGRSTYPIHYVSTVEVCRNHQAVGPGPSPRALDHGDGYEVPVVRQHHRNTAGDPMICDGMDERGVMTNFNGRENEEEIITALWVNIYRSGTLNSNRCE